MTDNSNEPLVLDLLEWVASSPKTYADVMDAWRTSCPRLTIWEDAVDRGLVQRVTPRRGYCTVELTLAGCALLDTRRRQV